jgi:hypothetical protein
MICPNCQAEYREGFSRCADCDVDLVEPSPDALVATQAASSAAETEDPFCEFWKGEDARVRAELCDILSEEGIAIRTFEWQDHLFNRTSFPIFRIAVPFSMFDRAEKAVADAYGSAEEADDIMNPSEEKSPEFRKLIESPSKEKLKGPPTEEVPSFWEELTWKRKKTAIEPEEEQGEEKGGNE